MSTITDSTSENRSTKDIATADGAICDGATENEALLEGEEGSANLGATAYLMKPILEEDLVAAISRLPEAANAEPVLHQGK
jgi:hypothetical protein